MDRLWTPWRQKYVSQPAIEGRKGVPPQLYAWPATEDHHCVFCNLIASVDYALHSGMQPALAYEAGRILYRGKHTFICLNAFPYGSGHILIIPYEHQESLAALPQEPAFEIMTMAQFAEDVLREVYHPDGLNLGMNLGASAGAGVAEHLHLHILPRWTGDTNFMTVLNETRVLPESLEMTWSRLEPVFVRKATNRQTATSI